MDSVGTVFSLWSNYTLPVTHTQLAPIGHQLLTAIHREFIGRPLTSFFCFSHWKAGWAGQTLTTVLVSEQSQMSWACDQTVLSDQQGVTAPSFIKSLVARVCTSLINSAWFTAPFFLMRGCGLRTRLACSHQSREWLLQINVMAVQPSQPPPLSMRQAV